MGTQLKTLDMQYRYNMTDNVLTLTGEGAGIGAFCSTIANSSREFDAIFNHYSTNFTLDKNIPGLSQLLGGKYFVSNKLDNRTCVDKIKVGNKDFFVMEDNACPIGFSIKKYITKSDLMSIDCNERAVVLMNAAVVKPENEKEVSNVATKIDINEIEYNVDISSLVQETVNNAVSNFYKDSHGFSCTYNRDEASIVFFSVPYDYGWNATIDNESVEIINSCGMMLLAVPEGTHSIDFSYNTPGFKFGKVVSVVTWIIFGIMIFLKRKNAK